MKTTNQIAHFTLLALILATSALAQDVAKPKTSEAGPNCFTAKHELAETSEGAGAITKDQVDAIISELKQIRLLLEKQQAQLARAAAPPLAAPSSPPQKVQMAVGNGWYSEGNPGAPVTLVEFADYQCPFCKKFHSDAYAELKKNYIDTGKVRFFSRDLPLDFHPFALKAAEAVRCAADQGKYWEFRDALFSNADPPNDDVIKKAAATLSLDQGALQSCLTSDKYKSDVQKDAAEAATLQISGTPSFVLAKSAKDKLDGIRIVGAQPYATFDSAIQALLRDRTELAKK
jgi:protein-disulfide isomerase